MKTILFIRCLALAGTIFITSCETDDMDHDDDEHRHHTGHTTTVTEETTISRPYSGTVQTQTVQRY